MSVRNEARVTHRPRRALNNPMITPRQVKPVRSQETLARRHFRRQVRQVKLVALKVQLTMASTMVETAGDGSLPASDPSGYDPGSGGNILCSGGRSAESQGVIHSSPATIFRESWRDSYKNSIALIC